jgi:hypothetical protein
MYGGGRWYRSKGGKGGEDFHAPGGGGLYTWGREREGGGGRVRSKQPPDAKSEGKDAHTVDYLR